MDRIRKDYNGITAVEFDRNKLPKRMLASNCLLYGAMKNCGIKGRNNIELIRALMLSNNLMENYVELKEEAAESAAQLFVSIRSIEIEMVTYVAIEYDRLLRIRKDQSRNKTKKRKKEWWCRNKDEEDCENIVSEVKNMSKKDGSGEKNIKLWKGLVNTMDGFNVLKGMKGENKKKSNMSLKEAEDRRNDCVDFLENGVKNKDEKLILPTRSPLHEVWNQAITNGRKNSYEGVCMPIDPFSVGLTAEPENGSWNCRYCTFTNTGGVGICIMCSGQIRGEGFVRKCQQRKNICYTYEGGSDEEEVVEGVESDSDWSEDEEQKCKKRAVRFPLYERNKITFERIRNLKLDIRDGDQCVIFIHPRQINIVSRHEVRRTMDLENFNTELYSEVYVVEKPNVLLRCQMALMFGLDRCVHGGCSVGSVETFKEKTGASVKILSNVQDWVYDDSQSFKPVVINEDRIVGIRIERIIDDLKLRGDLQYLQVYEYSLRKQAEQQMMHILREHLDEISMLLESDSLRMSSKFDFGYSPIPGSNAWNSRSGGIALCQMKKCKAYKMSSELRRDIKILIYIVYETGFCDLLYGKRKMQGSDTVMRRRMKSEICRWFDYDENNLLRIIPDAFTFLFTKRGVGLHDDSMNDSEINQDGVASTSLCVDDLMLYVKTKDARDRLYKLFENNTTGIYFTILFFSRSIIGTQTKKANLDAESDCPLYRLISASINSKSFEDRDVEHLANDETRKLFYRILNSQKRIDLKQDFTGYFTTQKEHLLRCSYIAGAYGHAYFTIHHAYAKFIRIEHLIEFWAFCSVEMNGSMLINEIVTALCIEDVCILECRRTLLSENEGEFYVLLSKMTIIIKQRRNKRRNVVAEVTTGSSTTCRYGNYDRLQYMTIDGLSNVLKVIRFFRNTAEEANSILSSSVEWREILRKFVQTDLRKKKYNNVKLASVRGNTAIQLGGFLGILNRKAQNVAFVTKGTNGFYVTLNKCYEGKRKKKLSTQEAEEKVRNVINEFNKVRRTGIIDEALVDNICCREERKKNNNLRNDVYLFNKWSNELQLLFRWKPDDCNSQVYIRKRWRNLEEYWEPVNISNRFFGSFVLRNSNVSWIQEFIDHYPKQIKLLLD